jgi:hypothetical protein
MQIAVLGGGNIGGTLGRAWAAAGHTIVYGVRDPQAEKVRELLAATGGGARAAAMGEALIGAEVVLVAIPGRAIAELLTTHGSALNGKIVIDATNQFGAPVMNALAPIAAAAPNAILMRAFNSLGWENFAEPQISGTQVDLFFCGADGAGRMALEQLIAEVGLRPVYAGGIEQAPFVDALGALWGALVFGRGLGRRLAFKLLTP